MIGSLTCQTNNDIYPIAKQQQQKSTGYDDLFDQDTPMS